MPVTNAQFDGSIPELYDRYLGPVLFEQYAEDMAAAVKRVTPSSVLEIACGTGIVTRKLRAVLPPGARLVATDLNEPMLSYARGHIKERLPLEWKQADAVNLPFEAAAFDAVVCQFGIMFVPDKAAAAREALRVLHRGGTFLFSVWDSLNENPLGEIAHRTIGEFFQSDPPDFYEVPFGYHDLHEIERLLSATGFSVIKSETVRHDVDVADTKGLAVGLVRGNPVINAIRERAVKNVDEITEAVHRELTVKFGGPPWRVPMQAHLITAQKPS